MLGSTSPVQPVTFALMPVPFWNFIMQTPGLSGPLTAVLLPRNLLLLTVALKGGRPWRESAPPAYCALVAVLSVNTVSVTDI